MGLISSLLTAGRSLEIYTAGIEVAGSNVANANTPGYVREELIISPSAPFEKGGLLFGTGASADGVRQRIDSYLESQIHQANADASSAAARQDGYNELELILSELSGQDLSSKLNEFTASVNELINQPELLANRQGVVQEGISLASSITTTREKIDRVRNGLTGEIGSLADEANTLIDRIAFLNQQIVQTESAGLLQSDAGALRSSRLAAMNRLSEIIPIRTVEESNGKVNVYSGSDYLIIEGTKQYLESYSATDRGLLINKFRFSNTKTDVPLTKGELTGKLESRDSILGGFSDQLDQYAGTIIQQVNLIHASGEGLRGFTDITASNAIEDSSVALNAAGLDLTPTHGSFEVKIYNTTTDTTQTTQIDIDLDGIGGNDTTLADLQSALDAVTNLNASIDTFGKLRITTDSGFEVKFSNDSSGVLAALGINTFFTGSDSSDIQVQQYLIDDPQLLAVGQGGGAGDNRNAIKLATFMENKVDSLGGQSLDQFYALVTAQIAESSSAEQALSEGFASFRDSLFGQRQQISGVSIDEEAIRIMQYQQGYTAAARVISTIDELFTALLNI